MTTLPTLHTCRGSRQTWVAVGHAPVRWMQWKTSQEFRQIGCSCSWHSAHLGHRPHHATHSTMHSINCNNMLLKRTTATWNWNIQYLQGKTCKWRTPLQLCTEALQHFSLHGVSSHVHWLIVCSMDIRQISCCPSSQQSQLIVSYQYWTVWGKLHCVVYHQDCNELQAL